MPTDESLQRSYYAKTSGDYDALHVSSTDEHSLALHVLESFCRFYGFRSVLDVGAGTGRALLHLRSRLPDLRVVGVEPVAELRAVGHQKGLSAETLVPGDATSLPFADGQFDVVTAFGVLHHVRYPELAIAEMFRVSAKAVFLSDANNYAQGGVLGRLVKNSLRLAHLWPLANLIKTRGRGYSISEGDGLFYSYSLYNSRRQIEALSDQVHHFNTQGRWGNPLWSHPHFCLLALKRGRSP